jgi:Arc/MetJ-type ribon-helix-helix transcriptional regulator
MGKIDKRPVSIPEDILAMAESAVAGGEFASVEHLVEAALRDWQVRRDADLAKLRGLIDEGLASPSAAWDGVDAIIAEGRRVLATRPG